MKIISYLILTASLVLNIFSVHADTIGHVDINFKLLGPDDKIIIEAFDDPGLSGVTCYYSHAVKGGLKGMTGVAEDSSDASLDCKQTGSIDLPESILKDPGKPQKVFKKRTSILFKTLQVMRFYDQPRNTLVYLVYSDKILEGSPKNSISVVPIMTWNNKQPQSTE